MGKTIFADLHNHTTASDGDFSPSEIVDQAKAFDIKAIGITDHDTLKGLKSAVSAGNEAKIEVVCGVELSVRFKRSYFTGTLHLLCYFPSKLLKVKDFVDFVNSVMANGRGEKLVRARVDEINRVFGPDQKNAILKKELTFEHISQLSDNATRRHFALALNQVHGITDPEVVNRIIGNDSPAYLPSGIDLEQARQIVQKKEVIAVLAHPAAGSFPGEGHYKEVLPSLEVVEKILPEFIDAGIQGLEVYYPGHIPAHQEILKEWAKKYNLLITGGSDCHDKSQRPFGVQGLSKKEFEVFKEAMQKGQ